MKFPPVLCFLMSLCSLTGVAQTELPPGRAQMAAAFDTNKNTLLIFGGSKHYEDTTMPKPDNALWSWDGSNWKVLSRDGPAWREDAKMAYNSKSGKTYLIGGRSYNEKHEPLIHDEIWVWDGKWTLLKPSNTPGKTLHTNIAYDPVRNRIVMFGGARTEKKDGPPFVNEVWEWDELDWNLIPAQNAPSPRIAHAMTYSPALRKILIIGGVTLDGTILTDIWSWDGTSFENLAGDAPQIELGQGNAICMDGNNGVDLLLSGRPISTERQYNSTWKWDGKKWKEINSQAAPQLREMHVMFYDPAQQHVILFGGNTRKENAYKAYNDLWTFRNDQWKVIKYKD